LEVDEMTTGGRSDNWFGKRIMKLTRFEKWFMNSARHARHTEQTVLALLDHVSLPPQPRCLEIGCGQGVVTRVLVERCSAQVVASDYDPAQVAVAQERLAGLGGPVEFRVVDARAMPFDDAAFDAVFSFGVLHHIPGGWREAVAETARVLKPGGWFAFTDLVVSARAGRLVRRLLPRLDQLDETALHGCLAQNGLGLEHYARGQGEFQAVLGLMDYCVAAAHKSHENTPAD
jgi:ubiquinone/menaquinone biosynthesis C-methylase UbiE